MKDQIHQYTQSIPPEATQSTAEKIVTFGVGAGGISTAMMDIANAAQFFGVVGGAFLVGYQIYKIARKEYRDWKRGRPANDDR